MTRFADDYVKFRAASQRYGSKVHALGASAPPRACWSPHEGRIIPKRSRRSHGWRTWGQPFAMHRRELTALSPARTRVHISLRLAARRASDTKDSKPHGSSSHARRSCERYDTCVVGFAAFASTAGGIHTTLQSAAPPVRVRSRAPLTQPHRRYIRCCVVDPRQARSHGLPGPVLALREREREAEKQAARKTRRI